MGVETAIIAGAAAYGIKEQRRARKNAERSANEQTAQIQSQTADAKREKSLLSAKLDNSKKKLAVGMARSQRRRSRGGLFGDNGQAAQSPLSTSLG